MKEKINIKYMGKIKTKVEIIKLRQKNFMWFSL
jgi:hypothetical protein